MGPGYDRHLKSFDYEIKGEYKNRDLEEDPPKKPKDELRSFLNKKNRLNKYGVK